MSKTIDEIFAELQKDTEDASYGEWRVVGADEAKQAIREAVYEVITSGRPNNLELSTNDSAYAVGHNQGLSKYESGLRQRADELFGRKGEYE